MNIKTEHTTSAGAGNWQGRSGVFPAQPAKPVQPIAPDLTGSIEEAEAAAAELDRLKALERKAASLDALRQQKQQQEWVTAVAPVADLTEAEARQLLAQAEQDMGAWREEFLSLVARMEALIARLPAIQKGIDIAARKTQQVAATRQAMLGVTGQPVQPDALDSAASGDWFELWRAIGGTNASLAPLPTTKERMSKWEPIIELLSKTPLVLYSPQYSRRRYSR